MTQEGLNELLCEISFFLIPVTITHAALSLFGAVLTLSVAVFAQRPRRVGFPPEDHPAKPEVAFQWAELAAWSRRPCAAVIKRHHG